MGILVNVTSAKEVKIAVGLALPPYFMKNKNKGMEMDIIKEALKTQNHTLKVSFVPFSRINNSLKKKKIDCVSPILERSGIKAYYSKSHVTYQNFAISLSKNNIKVNSINDLKDKKIVAFQNASVYLGDKYKKVVSGNKKYKEKAKQLLQAKLLYNQRTDVVISDINIFKFFSNKLDNKIKKNMKITYHPIFKKTNYQVAFNDEKLKDQFNKGLKIIKNNGIYKNIIEKYIGQK